MEPLYSLQQNPLHFTCASNAFESHELESLLNQLLPASFHGDLAIPYSSDPSQASLCQSLPPGDRILAAGLPNPNFHCSIEGHLHALPTACNYGDLRRGAGVHEAMPASLNCDNGDDAGWDHREPARFHGDQEGDEGPGSRNFKGEAEGRHSQMLQVSARSNAGAASSDHHRPAAASKISKAASVRDVSLTESRRRKKISQFFSKLEWLLPPDDVIKHDRCSLIESTIHYITSLEERVAKELKERKMFVDAMRRIDQNMVDGVLYKSNKEESCKKPRSNEAPVSCNLVSPKKLEECGEANEHAADAISITMIGDENVFINVVTPLLDPVLFTSLFIVLHHHHLEVITATLARTNKLYFSFSAKNSLSKECNMISLKDAISRALKKA